jgi:nickel-dependent lactate racemase
VLAIDVPKHNLLAKTTLNDVPSVSNVNHEIERAIQNPIAHDRIEDLAQRGKKTLILVDDFTRATPAYEILPVIVRRLRKAGAKSEDIRIMIAGGTHRAMTPQEVIQKVGKLVAEKFEILSHNIQTIKDRDQLVDLGKTSSGTPISVNRHVVEADTKIALGEIVGHPIAGWSGGAKIIQPGVCGEETTEATHWLQTKYREDELLGVADNPIRLEMEEIGRKVALDFIVNVILNCKKEIVGVVAGHPVEAHRKGVDIAKRVYEVNVPSKADIILADAYPHDLDIWQACKGIYAAEIAVKDGGTIILCAPCQEGVSREHPVLLEYGYVPKERVEKLLKLGKISDKIGASECAHGELLSKIDISLYSEISRDDTLKLNLEYAKTPKDALRKALIKHGSHAKVIVMECAGNMVPRLR